MEEKNHLIKSTKSFNLIVTKELEMKIRHLCSVFPTTEWSGILFYMTSGNMEEDNLVCTALDLFVMDVGNSGYTEFNDSPDILSYRVSHDLLDEGIYEGLIHSHHTMSTFFSNTDTSTLHKEGNNMSHFLSLIVNNIGEYSACITKKIYTKSTHNIKTIETAYYNTYEGKQVIMYEDRATDRTISEEKNNVYYMQAKSVQVERPEYSFNELDQRLKEIKSAKQPYVARPVNSSYTIPFGYYGNSTPSTTTPSRNNIAEEITLQLLTGSILLRSNITMENIAINIDSVYARRFGNLGDKDNLKKLKDWIDFFADYLMFSTDIDQVPNSKIDTSEELAKEVISKLEKLPKSLVVATIIDVLSNYCSDTYYEL